jgi:hypothetical protein
MMQLTTKGDVNYIIKGLLGLGETSSIYGPSGCGKTFLAIDLALHVAAGRPWRGQRVRPGGVVYVAAEAGAGIANRILAARLQLDVSGDLPLAIVPCPIDLRSANADTKELIKLVKEAAQSQNATASLIIIDTVARAMAGGDENSSEVMGNFVRHIDEIRVATGAHVCCIHHSGKDPTRGARGHSSLRAAVDTEIEVTRLGEQPVSVARVTKQRDRPTDGKFPFRLETVELGTDQDGDPITSCVLRHEDAEGVPDDARRSPLTADLKGLLVQLKNCLADHGRPAPNEHDFPSGLAVVEEKKWRSYARDGGCIPEDHSNASMWWTRQKNKLKDGGFLGEWKGYVWLAQDEADAA